MLYYNNRAEGVSTGYFNDNSAYINSSGNLSLGQSGLDDGQGDATHGYAKKDAWVYMEPISLPAALPTTNLTETVTRTSAGIWNKVYTAGGSVASFVLVRPPFLYRTLTGLLNTRSASNPHGWKLTAMYLNYIIATADATTVAVTFQTEVAQANNTARANSSTTALGTVGYENPPGTVAATLPKAQQAAPYVNKVIPGTPVFITTERQMLTAEIALTLPINCVLTITELSFNFSLAEY